MKRTYWKKSETIHNIMTCTKIQVRNLLQKLVFILCRCHCLKSKLTHSQTYFTHNYTSREYSEGRTTLERFQDTGSCLPRIPTAVSIMTERYHHGIILTGKKQHKLILTHDHAWNQHCSWQLCLFTITWINCKQNQQSYIRN